MLIIRDVVLFIYNVAMKISELIKELELVLEKDWDLQVVVQYRDGWWSYHWQDDDCSPFVKDWRVIL